MDSVQTLSKQMHQGLLHRQRHKHCSPALWLTTRVADMDDNAFERRALHNHFPTWHHNLENLRIMQGNKKVFVVKQVVTKKIGQRKKKFVGACNCVFFVVSRGRKKCNFCNMRTMYVQLPVPQNTS